MPERPSAATTTLIYAACAALWILVSGTVLFVAVDDPRLQAQIEISKGFVFVAISSGLLYLLLWVRGGAAPDALLHGTDELPRRNLRPVLLVPIILVLIAPMVGISVYLLYAQQLERGARDDLRGIATLKAQQIENWLGERRGDAMVLAVGRGFGERLAAIRDGSDPRQFDLVHDRLSTTRDAYAYESITLLDADGSVLVNVGEHAVPGEADMALVRRATAAGEVRMGDLWHDEARRTYLGFAAPLLDDASIAPVGAVLLRVRAQEFLYPLLDAWPTPSASGRTWLVRRDGERVRWLGDARRRGGTPSQRLLDDVRHPALAAVRTQASGAGTGEDEHGVEVLAAWRRVAGTDWRLVTVLARAEALAPARTTALWAAAVALFGATMVALAVLLMLRQQRLARRVALQVQADRLLKHFYELPFVGMAITSPRTGHWVQFNDHLCDMLGYSRKELVQRTWMELTHAEDLDEDVREFQRVLAGEIEGYAMEKRFIRKDQSVLSASMDVKCVRGPDGAVAYLVCVVRDISQRKATQARILKLSRLYLTLSRCNAAIVHCTSEQSLFAEVCLAAVQSGGAAMAWVGMLDPDSGAVQPRASFGTGVEYLRDIDILVHAHDARGLGPTGTAIRDGEPVWCQDFGNDPLTAPWHAAGARHGWRASAALPLRRGGVTIGALSLYVVEQNAFDDETRNLLEEIAAAVSFGLESLEREAARRRAAQALRDSEQRYRLLFDNSQDAILLTAPDGSILNANPAACRIFGGSEEQLRAAGRNGLIDTADPRVQRALEQRARSGSFSGELTMRRLDGEPFPAEISSALFTERDGRTRTSLIVRDITERKRAEAQLTYLAQHDVLTELPNRLLLTDRLNMALAVARRAGTRLALMFMDLDRFKMVNDSFGHDLGDRLLREAAARLRESVRASDTISRQGGDEFLVILPEIERDEDAALVAEKLIAAFAEPFVLDHTEIVITVSIGIVCFPQNGQDADTLLRNADAAMYVAKDRGRNRYQFYSTEMNARAHERLQLEADLRRAIEREQLHLAFQPQIALGTGAVIGIEALLRWSHPTRGAVPPAQFVAIAEDSGLIELIGTWALEAACAQQARWLSEGLTTGPVAVNVSAHQFRQPDFVDVVAATLSRSELDAQWLELELTEGIVMRGVDQVLHKLQALHALGVRIAIDDFGTGYSSLSYLKQFPIYRLKIDQSFTRGLPDDRSSAAIAQAVISMGHSLGLNVVAEGVETPAQEAYLRASSCDAGQGYLYARPMPAAECTRYLRARTADAQPDETPAAR